MLSRLKDLFSFYEIRNFSFLSFSQVVELGTGILYSIIVVRVLGGVTYGQLLVIISSAKILDQFLHLKVQQPLTSTLRTALDQDQEDSLHQQNTAAIVLTALSGLAGFVALFVVSLVEYYFNIFELSWFFFITIMFSSLVLRQFRNIIQTNFQANQLFGNLSYLEIISSIALNFLPLLFLHLGLYGICLGYLIGEVFIIFCSIFLLTAPFSRSKAVVPRLNFDTETLRSLFEDSWKYYQAKLLDRLADNVGNIAIAYFGGPKTLSFFNIGMKFFKFNIIIFPALRNYLFPRLVQKWNERRQEFFYTLRKYLVVSSLFSVSVLGLICLIVPYVLPLLFGNEFRPAVMVFYVMVPGYLISVPPGNIFREVCFASGEINTYRLLNFVVNPGFLLVLVPLTLYYSHVGAGLAITVRRVGSGIFQLYWYYRLYDSDWSQPGDE